MPIRSRNLTSDTRIKAARRPLKIIELRVAGMSMPLIAAKMKCSLPVVHRIITRELAKLTEKLAETTAQARQLALQRCEEHYHQARPKACAAIGKRTRPRHSHPPAEGCNAP